MKIIKRIIAFLKKLFGITGGVLEAPKYYTIKEAGKLVYSKSVSGMFLINAAIDIKLFYREKGGPNKGKIRINYDFPNKDLLIYVRQPIIGDIEMREELARYLYTLHRESSLKKTKEN